MDTAYLSALAALAGSSVGSLTSFLSSRLGQSAQLKAGLVLHDKGRRQELYHDFVTVMKRHSCISMQSHTISRTRPGRSPSTL